MIARSRLQTLTAILSRHDAHGVRTLADLHLAGFKFRTLDRAYRYLKATETIAGLARRDVRQYRETGTEGTK